MEVHDLQSHIVTVIVARMNACKVSFVTLRLPTIGAW